MAATPCAACTRRALSHAVHLCAARTRRALSRAVHLCAVLLRAAQSRPAALCTMAAVQLKSLATKAPISSMTALAPTWDPLGTDPPRSQAPRLHIDPLATLGIDPLGAKLRAQAAGINTFGMFPYAAWRVPHQMLQRIPPNHDRQYLFTLTVS
eukprot:365469-Chlamydomonas_euryale.AAC.32